MMLIANDNELKKTNPQKPYSNETMHILSYENENSKIESVDYFVDIEGNTRIFWTSSSLKAIQTLFLPKESNNVMRFMRKKRNTEAIQHLVSLVLLKTPRLID